MKILVNVINYLYSEAIKDLLLERTRGDKQKYIVECRREDNEFMPDIILTDFFSLDQNLLSRYPDAKVLLIDTGLEQEEIASLVSSYNMAGLLSCDTDVSLLKKAMKTVSSGETWIEDKNVKALLRKEGFVN